MPLAAAKQVSSIIAIFEERSSDFNPVNVATCIHRFAVHVARLGPQERERWTQHPVVNYSFIVKCRQCWEVVVTENSCTQAFIRLASLAVASVPSCSGGGQVGSVVQS